MSGEDDWLVQAAAREAGMLPPAPDSFEVICFNRVVLPQFICSGFMEFLQEIHYPGVGRC